MSALPSAELVRCDLANAGAALAMIKTLAARLDDWRLLVNSASVFQPDSVTTLDLATNREAMLVNSETPARMAQAYFRLAKAHGGRRVIHLTDQKLANPNPDFFSYTMSKHALDATIPMVAMAQEWPEDRIYGLAPGAILPSHDQAIDEYEISGRLNLLKRFTAASEVADTALFMAKGWLKSGTTLFVDSGQHLLSQPRDVLYLAREGATS